MAENKEKEIEKQQQYMQLQMLSQQMQKIEQELQTLETKRQELEKVKETVKEIQQNQDKETLIPIENGIFVKGKITDANKLVIGVGANILTEKTPEQAKQIVEKKQKEIGESIKTLLQELETTHTEGQKLQNSMME